MKQALRKILAVLVVLSIVLSVGIIAMTGSAAGEILFADDFSASTGLTDRGWLNDYEVVNGRMHTCYGSSSNKRLRNYVATVNGQSTLNWSDYSVQATIQMDTSVDRIGTSSSSVTPAVVAYAPEANKGLELGVYQTYKDKTSTTTNIKAQSLRLYERGGDGQLGDLVPISPEIDLSQPFTLKIEVKGDTVKGYLNGELLLTYTGITATGGMPGVATTSGVLPMWYSDFVVTSLAGEASSAPTSSAVSSQVSSTTSAPADYLFFDDFNSGTLTQHKADYGWDNDTSGAIEGGRLHVKKWPSVNNRYNYISTLAQYNAYFDYANCTTNDYTVETNVQLGEYASNTFAGVIVRMASAKSDGYEFGIALADSVPGVRLRKVQGNEILGGITPVSQFGIQKAATDEYHLKITVKGSQITCYVDGVQVFNVTNTACPTGVPAIRVAGSTGSAYYDNFKVTVAQEQSNTSSATSSAASSSEVSSGFTSSNDISSGGKFHFEDNFNSGSLHADWAYNTGSIINGVYQLNSGGNSNWVNTAAAKNLTNYAVQADVALVNTNTDGNQPTAGISIRTQSVNQTGTTGKGYEFTLTWSRNGSGMEKDTLYVRLYERGGTAPSISSSNMVLVKDILGEGNDDLFDTYTLRAEVIGNKIKCFINGYLAFDMTDDTWASGAFALRATNDKANFDNVTVDEIDTFTTPLPPIGGGEDTPTYTYPEGVYYQDDFSTGDFVNKGWNANQTLKNGQLMMYKTAGAALTNRADMLQLKNYTVEAWVTLSDSEPSTASGKLAGVVARTTSASGGFGFGLYITSNGTYSYRLYDYTNGDELARGDFAFSLNQAYRIRLVVNGNQIYGFIGDQLMVSKESTANPVGTAGVRRLGFAAFFDNYVVRESTEDEKNGIGARVVPPTADKNGIYYSDNFNTKESMFSAAWGDVDATFENGQRVIGYNTELSLRGNPGFATLKDYVVQADIVITNMVPEGHNVENNIISLVARGNYEFGLLYGETGSGYLRLYDRANGHMITTNHTVKVEQGKTYTLTLMVEGSKIRAFMNGELIFDKTDSALTDGAMGVRTKYTTTRFDNFVVRKITAADRTAASINTGTTPNTGDTVVYVAMAAAAMLLAAAVLLLSKRRKA